MWDGLACAWRRGDILDVLHGGAQQALCKTFGKAITSTWFPLGVQPATHRRMCTLFCIKPVLSFVEIAIAWIPVGHEGVLAIAAREAFQSPA
jgi:hypothetical protein